MKFCHQKHTHYQLDRISGCDYHDTDAAHCEEAIEMPTPLRFTRPTPGDWLEDFDKDNGQYQCKCTRCTEMFTGYKGRKLCKVCDDILMGRRATTDGLHGVVK